MFDDVVTIELKAIAGRRIHWSTTSFTPDGAVRDRDQGLTSSVTDQAAKGTESCLSNFPYSALFSGYDVPAADVTPTK